jgi:hypothetical protein
MVERHALLPNTGILGKYAGFLKDPEPLAPLIKSEGFCGQAGRDKGRFDVNNNCSSGIAQNPLQIATMRTFCC